MGVGALAVFDFAPYSPHYKSQSNSSIGQGRAMFLLSGWIVTAQFSAIDTGIWPQGNQSNSSSQYVEDRCDVPFPKPKDDIRANALVYPAWRRMILLSRNHPVLFGGQYHRRSNNGSCNPIRKKWFGKALFSRRKRNQNREAWRKSMTYEIRYLVRFRTRKELTFGGSLDAADEPEIFIS